MIREDRDGTRSTRRIATLTAALGAVALAMVATSCGNASIAKPVFQPTYVVSSPFRYAVVERDFVNAADGPGGAGSTDIVLRRGDVVPVDASQWSGKPGVDGTIWYRVVKDEATGWIRSSDLSIYENEAQARKAGARQ